MPMKNGSVLFATADCHLEKRLRNSSVYAMDSYLAFQRLSKYIIEYPCKEKALVIAGDMVEHPYVGGATLKVIKEVFDNLLSHGVRILSIMGNHDMGDKSIPASLGAEDIHETKVEACGLSLYGINSTDSSVLGAALKEVPPVDILVLHQPSQHLLNFEGAYDLSMYMIPDNVQHVVCGDIHKSDDSEISPGRHFISPGSLHPRNVSECSPRGIFKLENDQWDFVEIPGRSIRRFQVTSLEDLSLLSPGNPYEGQAPVMEIRYSPAMEGKIEAYKRENPECLYITSTLPVEDSLDLHAVDSEVNPEMEDCLSMVLDKDKERDLFSFLTGILTGDPMKTIRSKLKEYNLEMEDAV